MQAFSVKSGRPRTSLETYVSDSSWKYRKHAEEKVVESFIPEEGVIASRCIFGFRYGIRVTNLDSMQQFRRRFSVVSRHLDEEEKAMSVLAFVTQEIPIRDISRFHTLDGVVVSGTGLCAEMSLLAASLLNGNLKRKDDERFSVCYGEVAYKAETRQGGPHVWVEGPVGGYHTVIDPALKLIGVPAKVSKRRLMIKVDKPEVKNHEIEYLRQKTIIMILHRA